VEDGKENKPIKIAFLSCVRGAVKTHFCFDRAVENPNLWLYHPTWLSDKIDIQICKSGRVERVPILGRYYYPVLRCQD